MPQDVMTCITVDDSRTALAALKDLIDQVDGLQLVAEFDDARQAFNFLQNQHVDLIFLDVEMPEISGLQLIDNLENPPLIILVTAKEHYAIEAFEKHVVDYLVKPVSFHRFAKAVQFARKVWESRQRQKGDNDIIFVKSDGKWNKIVLDNIRYIQAMGDYVRIFTEDQNFMVNKTMKTLLQSLPEDKFVRVHRSYIVNTDHIESIEENSIIIGKDVIPISESYKSALMAHLNLLS